MQGEGGPELDGHDVVNVWAGTRWRGPGAMTFRQLCRPYGRATEGGLAVSDAIEEVGSRHE